VDWVTDCIGWLRDNDVAELEATDRAEDEWVRHVEEVGNTTLYPTADSWYMGSNVPGKPRVFMAYIGGMGAYREKCDEIAAKGYAGFALTPEPESVPA
jgi:cyclohexanone monooxygenase